MKNLKPEMIEKARKAKSAEELLELAKANNVEMTADEAKTYFAQLNPKSGELSDDDLDAVAGGGGCLEYEPDPWQVGTKVRVINGISCKKCGGTDGFMEYNHCWYVACPNCSKGILNQVIVDQPKLGVDVELV
jgi:hypothetical protein